MKIGPKHVFTGGTPLPQGAKAPALSKMVEARAVFPLSGRSLANRVQRPRMVTERGKALSKEIGKILKKIPSPFSARGS